MEIKQERKTDSKKKKNAMDDNRSRQNWDQGMRVKDRSERESEGESGMRKDRTEGYIKGKDGTEKERRNEGENKTGIEK